MDESEKLGVVFSKGINLKDLMFSKPCEFQIDINFKDRKKQSDPLLMSEDDLLNADTSDDSDAEEVLKNLAHSAEKNLLSSPEYATFDELAAKMTDCLPSGDVKILIIEEGDKLVPLDARVTIHYAAYWEKDEIPFDSTLTMNYGDPITYQLGEGQIIPGLEIGLTMVKGPKASFHLLVKPAKAWGVLGVPPRIRAATALFIVSLFEVYDRGAANQVHRFNDLSSEEQRKYDIAIKTVKASNSHASELFKKRLYSKAVKYYHKSLTILQISSPENDEQQSEIIKLTSKIYINLAVCYFKLHMPNKILLMCDDLGRISNIETNCKGLFYYGRAFVMLGQYEEAKKFYKKAVKLEPKNAEIGKAMSDLEVMMKNAAKQEKQMWQTAFQNELSEEIDTADIDEDFKVTLRETCTDLAGRTEHTQMDLPPGLMRKEVDYIKALVKDFKGLSVVEDGHGSLKKISLIKQNY